MEFGFTKKNHFISVDFINIALLLFPFYLKYLFLLILKAPRRDIFKGPVDLFKISVINPLSSIFLNNPIY
jgi:hypothetical protein